MSAVIDQASSPVLSNWERRQVTLHLEEILASEAFVGSRRSREFLRYVVGEALEGRGHGIKEGSIAVDVFRKGSDFDSQTQSLVRVKASEVRRRLAQAYEGKQTRDGVRIALPLGSYQPLFHFPPRVFVSDPVAIEQAPRRNSSRVWGPWIWGVGAIIAIVAIAFTLRAFPRRSSVDLFWDVFTAQAQPVLISLPAPTVLELKDKEKWLPLKNGELIPSSDLQEMDSYYVGVGAAQGAAIFAEQLALRHHSFILKFGADVSFVDLRQSPAILLGGYTSRWTMELTKRLPFQLTEEGSARIIDSSVANRSWQSDPLSSQPGPRTGYALITRLLRSDSGNLLLMASGIGAHDTQAAVEFLIHPEYFNQFARQEPNWPHQNFQIVIRSSIHGHTPGSPTAITWHVW